MTNPSQLTSRESIQIDAEEYMNKRVNRQLNYFDKKSGFNQKRYKFYKVITIVCAVLIPFISGLSFENSQIATGLLGIIIATSEGILSLNKYEENWVENRLTNEILKQEKLFFQTRTNHYDVENDKEAFQLFVERIETILAKESASWKSMMSQEKDNSNQNRLT